MLRRRFSRFKSFHRHLAQMAPTVSTLFLSSLPNELLLEVKAHIPHSDLRSHVCFYKSCHRVAALYGTLDEEEAFWRQACWLAGIGSIEEDRSKTDPYMWRRIAFDCIACDGFCKDWRCGSALLETNGEITLPISRGEMMFMIIITDTCCSIENTAVYGFGSYALSQTSSLTAPDREWFRRYS